MVDRYKVLAAAAAAVALAGASGAAAQTKNVQKPTGPTPEQVEANFRACWDRAANATPVIKNGGARQIRSAEANDVTCEQVADFDSRGKRTAAQWTAADKSGHMFGATLAKDEKGMPALYYANSFDGTLRKVLIEAATNRIRGDNADERMVKSAKAMACRQAGMGCETPTAPQGTKRNRPGAEFKPIKIAPGS